MFVRVCGYACMCNCVPSGTSSSLHTSSLRTKMNGRIVGGSRWRGSSSQVEMSCAAQVDPRYAVGGSGFFISGRLRIGWFVQGELVNFQVGADPANARPAMPPLSLCFFGSDAYRSDTGSQFGSVRTESIRTHRFIASMQLSRSCRASCRSASRRRSSRR